MVAADLVFNEIVNGSELPAVDILRCERRRSGEKNTFAQTVAFDAKSSCEQPVPIL